MHIYIYVNSKPCNMIFLSNLYMSKKIKNESQYAITDTRFIVQLRDKVCTPNQSVHFKLMTECGRVHAHISCKQSSNQGLVVISLLQR